MMNLGKMPKTIKPYFSKASKGIKTIYKYEYSEKLHCPRRVKTGEASIQDLIQSFADDIDFKNIGKMLVDTRDNVVSHFTDQNGEIVDVTGSPRDIHEFNALQNKMIEQFNALPEDIRVLFGNDFTNFRKSYEMVRLVKFSKLM